MATDHVWYTPTDYDALRDGPPYLASRGQHSKSAAYYDTPVRFDSNGATNLTKLLGVLQALVMLHQAHHWNTQGAGYYSDHLLFGRIYDESVGFVDTLAEKALGIKETPVVSALTQTQVIQAVLVTFGQGATPEEMVAASLKAENFCLACITQVLATAQDQGSLSHGLSNLLEGIADKHEEFVYLLQQRAGNTYSYQR